MTPTELYNTAADAVNAASRIGTAATVASTTIWILRADLSSNNDPERDVEHVTEDLRRVLRLYYEAQDAMGRLAKAIGEE